MSILTLVTHIQSVFNKFGNFNDAKNPNLPYKKVYVIIAQKHYCLTWCISKKKNVFWGKLSTSHEKPAIFEKTNWDI